LCPYTCPTQAGELGVEFRKEAFRGALADELSVPVGAVEVVAIAQIRASLRRLRLLQGTPPTPEQAIQVKYL
jgi:hypothetical protein